MMIFDINAWVGSWPFRSLRDNTPQQLVERLRKAGVSGATVSQIEAILHRNAQPANERLAESLEPHGDVLVPVATINPTYARWEDDLRVCHEVLGMRGVRLFPEYHGYEIDGPLARRVVAACRERGLPVQIPHRIEDMRQRHHLDPARGVSLAAIANLVAAYPDTPIIVTNARGIAQSPLWRRTELRDAAWYADTSLAEVYFQGLDKDLASIVEETGSRHLLFGTHVPFSYPESALVKRATLPVDAGTMEEISYRGAMRLGLTPESWTVRAESV
ncbi:MAG: amidohydrolase family protein [Limnochordia bacterium]|jgi:predicted TIM-barrel fold metal-dependent hydrolase